MSDMNVFVVDSQAVRVVLEGGEPWFVGKDVAAVLGYANPSKSMGNHCKRVTKRYPLQTAGGIQDVRIITETDMLRLIVGSKLPAAEGSSAGCSRKSCPASVRPAATSIPGAWCAGSVRAAAAVSQPRGRLPCDGRSRLAPCCAVPTEGVAAAPGTAAGQGRHPGSDGH